MIEHAFHEELEILEDSTRLDELDNVFRNPTIGSLHGRDLLTELVDYIQGEPQQQYLVTVGTDSRQVQDRSSFVSVIAVQRVGRGGRYFWRRYYRPAYQALRRRIYREANQSLALASELSGLLDEQLHRHPRDFDVDLEIHVDIGTGGPTADMINEIVGLIRGSGYEVRTKPDAYCAAVVADRYA